MKFTRVRETPSSSAMSFCGTPSMRWRMNASWVRLGRSFNEVMTRLSASVITIQSSALTHGAGTESTPSIGMRFFFSYCRFRASSSARL
eukprot:gene8360-10267_t